MNKITNALLSISLPALLAGGMVGCSSTDTPPANTATVTFVGQTEGSNVNKAAWGKGSSIAASGAIADSVEITGVRFLLSAVKLHPEGNDTTKDGELKVGPFVAEFTPGLTRTYSTVTVPSGSYEKIKFEIHKFPSTIASTYLNDPVFTDFVTNERSTVIIEGRVWPTNTATPVNFVYKSHITANLETKFPGAITLGVGSTNSLAMIFSPMLAFKSTFVLDPRDPLNSGAIDGYLKTSIKALKK
jgi:hypothetical protein